MKSILPTLFSLLGFFSLMSLLSLVPVASGHNMVKFINHCPYPIFFWQVGPSASGIDGSDRFRQMVPGNSGSVVHPMLNTEALGGGLSLKIRDLDHYAVAPAGIIQVEYHLEPSTGAMWYDLSAVDCNLGVGSGDARFCPLIQGGIKLYVPGDGECPTGSCNSTGCDKAYIREGGYLGEPSWVCKAGSDLFLETCTEKAAPQTFSGRDPMLSAPVHQAIPDPIAQPSPFVLPQEVAQPPASLKELEISPNGLCGPREGYTCTGSQHGVCCSYYGYCGNRPEYCYAGCQSIFGTCLDESKAHPQIAGPEPLVVSIVGTVTDTSVVTRTTTTTEVLTETETATETMFIPVQETVTTTAVFTPSHISSAKYSGKIFTGYPRRHAAAYVNM
ncbi:hypothetical protein G6011_11671 [Alternaria panax]|uniref:Chitin-binding type-1 domain-containing protein n=1 Tax=Alternaria panax TaxID=48097 RepID=A0AAD4NS59_9PLEO|nr:hypothetical protein G6011_11671 [Alternaria panax]